MITNKKFQTNIPNIYAIGDCRGEIQLAHVASAEGVTAVETIMGYTSKIDFRTIPYAVYTKPELAAVGLTEDQATHQGYEVKTGKFPLYANGKALIMAETNGIVKFVVDSKTEEILGLHMAGPRVTELIVEGRGSCDKIRSYNRRNYHDDPCSSDSRRITPRSSTCRPSSCYSFN